jgi:hypothetical protein
MGGANYEFSEQTHPSKTGPAGHRIRPDDDQGRALIQSRRPGLKPILFFAELFDGLKPVASTVVVLRATRASRAGAEAQRLLKRFRHDRGRALKRNKFASSTKQRELQIASFMPSRVGEAGGRLIQKQEQSWMALRVVRRP